MTHSTTGADRADPTARALRLLGLLQSRRSWSGAELAERLGVTTRTVRRDVERLRDLGYPVSGGPGVAGGYRLASGGALPPLMLDDEQAVAVAVSLGLGAGEGVHGVAEAALRTLTTFDQVLPPRLRERVEAIRSATVTLIRPGTRSDAELIDPDLLLELARAVRDGVRVRLDYVDRDGAGSERDTEPYRLVTTGRRWYLLAWDRDRDDWRTFRLDRIRRAQPSTLRFARREEPDAAAHLERSLTQWPYRHVGRVRLTASAAQARTVLSPMVATVTAIDEHHCLVEAGADRVEALAWYLAQAALRLDVELVVLEPPELAETLVRLGERLRAFGLSSRASSAAR
ncbi:MAG: YafY family protein [Kineosporiaceae bacterium]